MVDLQVKRVFGFCKAKAIKALCEYSVKKHLYITVFTCFAMTHEKPDALLPDGKRGYRLLTNSVIF